MKVAFRVDASLTMGTGHVMRCLTLANALRKEGAQCTFICRQHPGNLIALISQQAFQVVSLPVTVTRPLTTDEIVGPMYDNWLGANWKTDAEATKAALGTDLLQWLIVDHYALDTRWESALRTCCQHIMVIDDLADRPHNCDLLLDQNHYQHKECRYKGLTPRSCVTLLGPRYALLRPEFEEAKAVARFRDGTVRRVLIFMGGNDPVNETERVIHAIRDVNIPDITVEVVVGPSNPNKDQIRHLCDKTPKMNYHCNISNMAELIRIADLGIGAGGSAMWERCFLGLPTITVVFASNQLRTTEDVGQAGAIDYLGVFDKIRINDYVRAIKRGISDPEYLSCITSAAVDLMRGHTGTDVIDAMNQCS